MLCKVMQVSPSAYYASLSQQLSKRQEGDARLRDDIAAIHKRSRKTYGKRRIQAKLRSQGKHHGLARIARLMADANLKAKATKKYKVTTLSEHDLVVYENVLNRDFNPEKPNTYFTSDITYIRTLSGWLFLAVIIDLFSRKVVGWAMNNHMRTELISNALLMAKQQGAILQGGIHHSDRGSQYCSDDFQALLKANEMTPSMSRRGNCWDNAPTESFFHSLKVESIEDRVFLNHEEAKREIFDYIEVFYNRERIHSSLGYTSPQEFENMALAA